MVAGPENGTIAHNALHVLDVSDPVRPVEVAQLPLDTVSSAIAFANGYVFRPGKVGVRTIDVRDRQHPADVGILPSGGDAATDAVVDGGLVYVTAGSGEASGRRGRYTPAGTGHAGRANLPRVWWVTPPGYRIGAVDRKGVDATVARRW